MCWLLICSATTLSIHPKTNIKTYKKQSLQCSHLVFFYNILFFILFSLVLCSFSCVISVEYLFFFSLKKYTQKLKTSRSNNHTTKCIKFTKQNHHHIENIYVSQIVPNLCLIPVIFFYFLLLLPDFPFVVRTGNSVVSLFDFIFICIKITKQQEN